MDRAARRRQTRALRKGQLAQQPPSQEWVNLPNTVPGRTVYRRGPDREAAWDRLRLDLLAVTPQCPDCGAPWDMDTGCEEEGALARGYSLTMSVVCSAYDRDRVEGREPAPHPRSRGQTTHELVLASPTWDEDD